MKRKQNSVRIERIQKWLKKHKNYVLGLSTAIIVVILFGSVLLTSEVNNTIQRTNPEGSGAISEAIVAFEDSPLTGLPVSPELTELPVTAVIIENSPEARPQSGLTDAGIVYEASVEGGITRFLALYQEEVPAVIGPVRSLRPYFNQWILQYDANVAHVGGSFQSLAEIGPLGIKDLDEFRYSGSYWRDSSRYAPHNSYTSGENIKSLQSQLGFNDSSFEPLTRKDEAPSATPTATDITIDISGYIYNPVFNYNKAQNAYERTVAGAPQKDRETGERIMPKSVVVLEATQQVLNDVGHLSIQTTGTNNAWVFQDGTVTKATWSKPSADSQLTLTDENNKSIALNRGQTWITVMPGGNSVSY